MHYDPTQGQDPNLPGGPCAYRTGDLYEYLPPYAIGKKLGSLGGSAEHYVEQKIKKPEEDFMNALKTVGVVAVIVVGGLVALSILKK